MRKQIVLKCSVRILLGVVLSVCAAPVFAQGYAKSPYAKAMNDAVREISKDPCNASSKFGEMMPTIIAAAKQSQAGVDDLADLLKRTADRGCANLKLTIPKLELLLIAGKQRLLDACTFSQANDYTTELAMARVNYSALGVGIQPYSFNEVPCMAEFLAAILTGQDVSQTATSQPAALPARGAPARRRQ